MAIKPNNFLKYLEDNHYDQLHKALLYYIKRNKEHLIVDRYDLIGAENIEIVDIKAGDDHNYYRENGVHCVPKVVLDDLIIK